jgi:hypothetical protein
MPTRPVSLLERELSVSLPEQYKSALLAYPFAVGSVGEEMLVADVEWLLERNRANNRTFAPGKRDTADCIRNPDSLSMDSGVTACVFGPQAA